MKMTIEKKYFKIFIFQLILTFIIGTDGTPKYVIALFISFILLVKDDWKIRFSRYFFISMIPILFNIGYGLMIAITKNNINVYTFKYLFFYLVSPILAYAIHVHYKKNNIPSDVIINIMFCSTVITFLIYGVRHFNTTDLMENATKAYALGLFAIYYLWHKRDWRDLKIIFILVPIIILAHKRIVILAAICAIIINFFLLKWTANWNKKKKNNLINIVTFVFAFIVLAYLLAINNGWFDVVISKYGINTMGRDRLYDFFKPSFSISPFFLGQGLGFVGEHILNGPWISIHRIVNLHNDWLHMYIEIGFLGFAFYIISSVYFIKKYIPSLYVFFAFSLMMYTFILALTDNILIYISYLYFYYFILYQLVDKENNQKNAIWENTDE